jgi:hypothetical protein
LGGVLKKLQKTNKTLVMQPKAQLLFDASADRKKLLKGVDNSINNRLKILNLMRLAPKME